MTDKKFPKATVGAYIFNSKGELFLMNSPKWGDLLIVPGGHIEYGEKIEDALKREVKEETGLDVENIEQIDVINMIEPDQFTIRKAHFIGLQLKAKLIDDKQEVILDEREGVEYIWLKPSDVIKRDDVNIETLETIKKHFLKKKLFNKKCKNCAKQEKECQEYKTGWQRALADYKNLQNEIDKKKSDWAKYSEVQILEEFLPVYEHLKMSIDNDEVQTDKSPWVEGVKYVLKQFREILDNHGIEEIKTVGEKFDPSLHEAVSHEKAENKDDDEIIKEVSPGYKMGDRILKAARVIVNN